MRMGSRGSRLISRMLSEFWIDRDDELLFHVCDEFILITGTHVSIRSSHSSDFDPESFEVRRGEVTLLHVFAIDGFHFVCCCVNCVTLD